MPIELKPCPFCGKSAAIITYGDEKRGKAFDICCEHDGCILVATDLHPTIEGAIEAWNRRADDAAI